MDLKELKVAVKQLSEKKKIDEEVLFEMIESVFAAAYKKGYAKVSQIIKARFNRDTGDLSFFQVKEALTDEDIMEKGEERVDEDDKRVVFNPERHIKLEDAKLVQSNIQRGEEIFFPLNTKSEFSRIAAQSAAQMLSKSLREAEKELVMKTLKGREGEIVSGIVQRFERGAIFVNIENTIAKIPYEEKIPGERFREGESIRALITSIDERTRTGNFVTLSRGSSDFVIKLFALNSPELAEGKIKIEKIARIPGQRTKIAVLTNDEATDPIGSLVGPRGVRVLAVRGELNGGREYIDIMEYTSDINLFVEEAISPIKITSVEYNEKDNNAVVTILDEDASFVFERGGQNVLLVAELVGVNLEIKNMSDELLITIKDGVLEKHVDESRFMPERREYTEEKDNLSESSDTEKNSTEDESTEIKEEEVSTEDEKDESEESEKEGEVSSEAQK